MRKKIAELIMRKEADLDVLDDQIMGLPETSSGPGFDTLAQKREEIEQDIRQMRENMALLDKWEEFKGGDWSDDIKNKLKGLDSEIGQLVSNEPTMDAPAPMGMDPLAPPPTDPLAPPPPPAPAATEPPPATDPMPPAPEPPPADEPTDPSLDAPVGTDPVVAPESNFSTPNKEAAASKTSSTPKKGDPMANNSQPNMKERIAASQAKRAEAISKEAQTRVASAWTIAKTMLPEAPAAEQQKFAQNLLTNSTTALKVALRNTARNVAFLKVCEALASIHKVELNDLMEDPSVLSREQSGVVSELKGDAKNAGAKVADDRKECGPLPTEYPEPTRNEPADIDAGKAGNREKDTVDKSTGDKTAAAKCECGKAECTCQKTAAGEDMMAPEAPGAPAAGAPPAEPPAPTDAPMDAPPAPGQPADVKADSATMEIHEQIEQIVEEVKDLEQKLTDETEEQVDLTDIGSHDDNEEKQHGDEEGGDLDFANIFNEDNLEEKKSSLAQENEEAHTAGEEGDDDFFAPSSATSMEASLEDSFGDPSSMFDIHASDADPLASLIASKTADLGEVVKPGEIAKTFETDAVGTENRDAESDHNDSMLADILKSLDQDGYASNRDTAPEMKEPTSKEASAEPIRRLKVVAGEPEAADLGSLLFGSEE